MDIIKNIPSKKNYVLMKRYQNVTVIKKISIKLTEDFFKVFPEEIRGRKTFRIKEEEIMTLIAFDELLKKAIRVKCDCIGNTKEILRDNKIKVCASFYKKIKI
ncbi:hypothetical protein N8251_00250 [Alphaproteobacteria bacterium]|nr:hypothetical protein [Alphaproteobacteria bacterium]